MPPLRNPRHERFVGLLLEGKAATDAYGAAGFKRDDGNAARLKANPKVAARLAELQSEIASETKVTVAGLISELEAARKAATNLEQFSTVVKSIEAKARISGLLVEKKQVEVGGPGDFSHCETDDAIEAQMVEDFFKYDVCDYHDVQTQDREQVRAIIAEGIAYMGECWQRARAVIEAVKARPVTRSAQPRMLPPPYGNGRTRY